MKKTEKKLIVDSYVNELVNRGFEKEEYKTAIFLKGKNKNYPILVVFETNRVKPIINMPFYSETSRENKIEETKKYIDIKSTRRKAGNNDEIETGLIFVSSWGYEQTNVDFLQVVGKKGKSTLVLREIEQEVKEKGNMSGKTLAIKDKFIGPEIEKRLDSRGGFYLSQSQYFKKWDGKEKYVSWYA